MRQSGHHLGEDNRLILALGATASRTTDTIRAKRRPQRALASANIDKPSKYLKTALFFPMPRWYDC